MTISLELDPEEMDWLKSLRSEKVEKQRRIWLMQYPDDQEYEKEELNE